MVPIVVAAAGNLGGRRPCLSCRHTGGVEEVGRQWVGQVPEDAHGPVAAVLDVSHGAGVEVWGCAEVAVGFLGFANEQMHGGAALPVADVALPGWGDGCGGAL